MRALRFIVLLSIAAYGAGFMYEANATETKACCKLNGQCVVVQKWKICPRGYY